MPTDRLWCDQDNTTGGKPLIVRDPAGRQADDDLFRTDPTANDADIAERFYVRWTIEEAIKDAKQLGGFEHTQGWCPPPTLDSSPRCGGCCGTTD